MKKSSGGIPLRVFFARGAAPTLGLEPNPSSPFRPGVVGVQPLPWDSPALLSHFRAGVVGAQPLRGGLGVSPRKHTPFLFPLPGQKKVKLARFSGREGGRGMGQTALNQ